MDRTISQPPPTRAHRYVNLAAAGLPGLMILASGIAKLAGAEGMVDGLAKYGVAQYMRPLGVMEIVFALLFIFPQTMKLGFILCSCYFAGAIAAELSHGALTPNPFVPIMLVWIGAFIRNRSIFFGE